MFKRIIKYLVIISLLLFYIGLKQEALADTWETTAYAGAVLDIASTAYALEQGAVEANPILGEDPNIGTLLLVGALNVGLVYWVNETWSPRQAKKFNQAYSIVKLSVSTNNFIIAYEGNF